MATIQEDNRAAMPAWVLRFSAILEIGVIFLGGTLIARFLAPKILPARLSQDANELFLSASPDFIEIGAIVAADLLLRYGVMLGLALAFGWWHRKRGINGYGIISVGKPISFHILTGILIVSVGGFIPRLLITLREYITLGSAPLDFEILFSIEWNLAFWVYMAVSKFHSRPHRRGTILSGLCPDSYYRGVWGLNRDIDDGPDLHFLPYQIFFPKCILTGDVREPSYFFAHPRIHASLYRIFNSRYHRARSIQPSY